MTHPQTESPPSVRWRARAAALAGVVAAGFVYALYARQTRDVLSDWDPTFVGTQALLHGRSPYAAIQVPPWPNYLLYPLPALLLSAPFTFIPLAVARALFAGIGAAAFTFVITARGRWTLWFLISGAMLWSWITVQWPPLLIAAALTPTSPGCSRRSRPSAWPCGAPIRTARPSSVESSSWGLCFLVWPGWVHEWLASVAKTPHKSHFLRPGGFLLLLALLRWRRPEARLLAVLSLMPQTTALYEALPLALAAERKVEAAAFASLTMVAHLLYLLGPQGAWPIGAEYQWWVMLCLIYLPVLGLILSRPNVAPDPRTEPSRSQPMPSASATAA